MSRGRWALVAVGLLLLAGLAAFPPLLFPHPGTNEAIGLSSVGPLVYLATLVGAVVVGAVAAFRRLPAAVATGPGIFLVAVAISEILGLLSFGNFSNDRYLTLIFAPLPTVLAGLITLGTALLSPPRRGAAGGMLAGAAAGAVFAVWLFARGSAAWLQAPYGLDLMLLVALGVAALACLGFSSPAGARGPSSAPPPARPRST